jgi:methyl-accepting chemotaxis protein
VASIKSVADLVGDIAIASAEQATGLDQVNKALTQMDEVTQQNSALVEENAATAKTLESQSAAMTQRVAFFRIDGTGVAEYAAPAPQTPVKAKAPAAPAPARRGGIVGRMQSALATALKQDPDWEEF